MEYKRLMSETEMNQDRRVGMRGYMKPHPNLIK